MCDSERKTDKGAKKLQCKCPPEGGAMVNPWVGRQHVRGSLCTQVPGNMDE